MDVSVNMTNSKRVYSLEYSHMFSVTGQQKNKKTKTKTKKKTRQVRSIRVLVLTVV